MGLISVVFLTDEIGSIFIGRSMTLWHDYCVLINYRITFETVIKRTIIKKMSERV